MCRPKLFATSPVFVVSNLLRSVDFYERLGFTDKSLFGNPPTFAMVTRNGFDVMLSLAATPDEVRPNGKAWDLHLRIADASAEQAALEAAGIRIDRGPKLKEDYGMIELEVLDPDGYRICLGQDDVQRPEDADK